MDEKKVDEKKLEDVTGGILPKVGDKLYESLSGVIERMNELEKAREKKEAEKQ